MRAFAVTAIASLAIAGVAAVPAQAGPAPRVWTPAVTVIGADAIAAGETRSITVRGTGFDPSKQGGQVAGIYIVFGPNPAAIAGGYLDPNIFGAASYLPAGPNSSGEFQVVLSITGTYVDGNGKAWDPASTAMGISTWDAHRHSIASWDSFTPIAFTSPLQAPEQIQGAKVAKVKASKAVITWRQPGAATRAASSYQVRVSKANSKKYRGWVTVANTKAKVSGVGTAGKYRVQIQAVNAAGSSPVTTLTFRKR